MTHTSRRRLPILRALLVRFLLAWIYFGPGFQLARAQTEAAGDETGDVVITRVAQYWQMPAEQRAHPHQVDLELVVLYYDPIWNLLWGVDHGTSFYLPAVRRPMAMSAGDLVHIEGRALTADGLDGEQARVTRLKQNVPLYPVSGNGRVAGWKNLNNTLVALNCYVDRQLPINENHFSMSLVVDGMKVLGRVWLNSGVKAPQLEGHTVSVSGVYQQQLDPSGQLTEIELWIGSLDQIKVTGTLQTDPRFKLPVTPIDRLRTLPMTELVHIVGHAKEQRPGEYLKIEDNTGEASIETAQTDAIMRGDLVEAIGNPGFTGLETRLWRSYYRVASDAARQKAEASGPPVRLRLVDQVKALSDQEAAHGRQVHLWGVVTWTHPSADYFFLQDASGGLRIKIPNTPLNPPPVVGTAVEVLGQTEQEGVARAVAADSVRIQTERSLPLPQRVTLAQALSGVGDSERIEINGYLQKISRDPDWCRLQFTTATGEFTALLPPESNADRYLRALVSVTGVFEPIFNDRRQAVGMRLWVPSLDDMRLEEAFPADPFALPHRSIRDISQFGFLPTASRWAHTDGTVTLYSGSGYMYLQDGPDSIRVLTRATERFPVGSRVEVVGIPGREGGRLVLREAEIRPAGPTAAIEPFHLSGAAEPSADLDGRLVQVEGSVVDVALRSDRPRVTLQADGTLFDCIAATALARLTRGEDLSPGARVRAEGIYQIERDDYQQPYAFHVLIRQPADLLILQSAPWWTVRRAMGFITALGVLAALGIVAVLLLRSRLQQQTEQIRNQLEKEARLEAELERSSRLESLGVLAGGIAHDFNNLLTVIVGNVTLTLNDLPEDSPDSGLLRDAIRGAMRARDLTQQLLTFARGGDPILTSISLPEVVREAAEFALRGANIAAEFKAAPNLWPAAADKGQIGQVVHNLALNAAQAMPQGGRITFTLENERRSEGDALLSPGKYVKLTVADNGPGVAPEHLGRIFDPYFSTKKNSSGLGLATVRSIVRKHQGHIVAESTLGQGCTFCIWLPAADSAPQGKSESPFALPRGEAQKKVLFMDDDPAIQLVAGKLLERLGYRHVITADGAQAVEAYSRAKKEGEPFDVVILDLTVPGGMGGKDAMNALRQIDSNVRAIVSSGYSSDPVLSDFAAHGFKAMVGKPYNVNDLAEAIQRVLRD